MKLSRVVKKVSTSVKVVRLIRILPLMICFLNFSLILILGLLIEDGKGVFHGLSVCVGVASRKSQ